MQPSNAESFLGRAIALGREGMNRGEGGPFGAVVEADGVILGEGWNRVLATNDPTAHAEINAIRAACARLGRFHLEEATLYTSCEPCPMCLAALYWAGIRKVYYAATRHAAADAGFADEHLYTELGKLPANRQIPFIRLPLPEADAVFAEFKAKPDKRLY
jgi:guanine deaminase